MATVRHRNPRAEASALLGGRDAVVLEPSPPAVLDGPWFADDPVAPARADEAAISPLVDGPGGWQQAVDDDPTLAEFARSHWLANLSPLQAAPPGLAATRTSLNAVAFGVLSVVRQQACGKIGLRWTEGGFGTPFLEGDRQVRVEGNLLVVQDRDGVASQPITTLRAAGAFVGVTPGAPADLDFHDAPTLPGLDDHLEVDPTAATFLGDWFGFATHVLEALRLRAGSPEDTRVQIWPEHFDPAIELGDGDAGERASYGASPGDDAIDQPYLYVAPWSPQQGPFWQAPFGGAALPLEALVAASDPVAAAAAFFAEGRALLA